MTVGPSAALRCRTGCDAHARRHIAAAMTWLGGLLMFLLDAGESFVFSSWNGEPQCFLSEDELVDELGRAGFAAHRRPTQP